MLLPARDRSFTSVKSRSIKTFAFFGMRFHNQMGKAVDLMQIDVGSQHCSARSRAAIACTRVTHDPTIGLAGVGRFPPLDFPAMETESGIPLTGMSTLLPPLCASIIRTVSSLQDQLAVKFRFKSNYVRILCVLISIGWRDDAEAFKDKKRRSKHDENHNPRVLAIPRGTRAETANDWKSLNTTAIRHHIIQAPTRWTAIATKLPRSPTCCARTGCVASKSVCLYEGKCLRTPAR